MSKSLKLLGNVEITVIFNESKVVRSKKYGPQILVTFNYQKEFGIHKFLTIPQRLNSKTVSSRILSVLLNECLTFDHIQDIESLSDQINDSCRNQSFKIKVKPTYCGRFNDIKEIRSIYTKEVEDVS